MFGGVTKMRCETMFAIKTYIPCSFEHLFSKWLCSLKKDEYLINSLFSVKSKIIMPRTFKEERGQAIGILAAGGSKKETILGHNRWNVLSQNAILTNWDIIGHTEQ